MKTQCLLSVVLSQKIVDRSQSTVCPVLTAELRVRAPYAIAATASSSGDLTANEKAVRVKLTYYGQKERDVDIFPGDLLYWVGLDGAFGVGLLVGFVEEPHKAVFLKILVDGAIKTVNKSLFFRLKVLGRRKNAE